MKRVILFVIMIMFSGTLLGQKIDSLAQTNYCRKLSDQQWINDLNFIINRLDSVHPNPYYKISKEQFVVECKKLQELIPKSSDNEILNREINLNFGCVLLK